MRFSKSASTLAKQKIPHVKQQLEMSRTNTFTEDDFKNLDNKSITDLTVDHKKVNSIKRTRSANFIGLKQNKDLIVRAKSIHGEIKHSIKKRLPKVTINKSFYTKPCDIQIENGSDSQTQHSDDVSTTKMGKNENTEFRMQPIDPELKAYVSQKRSIRDKIHEHWKLELNVNSLPKGPSNIINDNMYKPDQQWMNISIAAHENDMDKKQKVSLIDTFTSDKTNDTYKVSGDIGSLIAQKLIDGDRMRVCRNGELVNKPVDIFDHKMFMLDNGKKDLSRMFSDLPIPRNSILSWNDQVNKDNIRILEPSLNEVKLEKKLKPERNLIVKKLIDEDEFKPKARKSPLDSKEFKNMSLQSPRKVHSTQSLKLQERVNSKTAVEVVGFSRKNTNNEIQKIGFKEDKITDPEDIFTVSLTPAKPMKTNGKLYENLNDKIYDEIFENLTNRYSEKSSDLNDILKKKPLKVNIEKRKSVPINLDLRTNNKDDKLMKSLEKKYKNLIYHDSKSNSIEPDSTQIFKNLFHASTSSSNESIKQKKSELNENLSFKLQSLDDGLYDRLTDYRNQNQQTIFKPLSTIVTKTNKNNTKIYSNY